MKLKLIIFGIIGLLLLFVIGTYTYYGGFEGPTIKVEECGGETLVYEKMTGDYAQSSTVSTRVYQKLLDDYGILTTKGFGIYYDNPKTKTKTNLRADVGCILESDLDKLEVLKTDFEVSEYPVGEYLVSEFPYKGVPSIMFGVLKVYPLFETYVEENGYEMDTPVMEIWDMPNKKITYRKKLIKRD